SAGQLGAERPEMTQSHDADVRAELFEVFFRLPSAGEILDDLVSAPIPQPADRVLVAQLVLARDRSIETFDVELVDYQDRRAGRQTRGEMRQEWLAPLSFNMRPPQVRHPNVEPRREMRERVGVSGKQGHVRTKIPLRRNLQGLGVVVGRGDSPGE